VLIAAHGNSLRALVKYLDNIPEADIVELNIPTGMPLVYELDDDLKPLNRYYLGDPEKVKGRHGSGGRAGQKEVGFGVGVVVPDFDLPTSKARSVLPASYSRADAVFNVQRAALLVAALAAGVTSAFPAALEDRFHQPYRIPLVPGLDQILKLRAPGLLGCTLSGAGPSILVFYERGCQGVCGLVQQIFRLHNHASEILLSGIADHGFEVIEETESCNRTDAS
jgi:hypothetical protein